MERLRFSLAETPPWPLDRLLPLLVSYPGPEILQLIRQGSVWWADGVTKFRIKDPSRVLAGGELEIFRPDKPILEFHFDPRQVIWEDDHLLAVYKPSGLNTVQSPFSDLDNLVHGVQGYLRSQGGTYEVNAVHRLDLPAQGLVLFGKHKAAEKALHLLFFRRRIKKIYLAEIPPLENPVPIWKIKDQVEWRGRSQSAWSFLRLLETKADRLVYAASPLTGRTHQLRIHFSRYLAPILGDSLYGSASSGDELRLASVYYRLRHPVTRELLEISFVPPGFRPVSFSCQTGADPLS